MTRTSPFRLLISAAFAVAMAFVTWVVISLARGEHAVSIAWPIGALATAFLVRWTSDVRERVLTLSLTIVGIVIANLTAGSPPVQAVAMGVLNFINIAFAVWQIQKFGRPIDNLKAFAAFVAGSVLLSPILTGVLAVGLFAATDPGADLYRVFMNWFAGGGLGMVIIGGFALTVRAPRRDETAMVWLKFFAVQLAAAAGVAFILFQPGPPALFMLVPFVVAGALSHRELGGVTAVVVTSILIWTATLMGYGPARIADLASVSRVGLMQLVLASLVFTALPISALLRRLDAVAADLRERRERAEELNALKARLLAYVSHEIRSPLSGVTTLAQLLRDGALGELTQPQREGLDRIALAGAEVDQLARDLTDAAAIQAGRARVSIGRVQVGETITSAVSAARFRITDYQAEIETVGGCEALDIAADPLRVRQILVNLLVNAAKYGGRPAQVRIAAIVTARGTVRFEVSDNGAGVPVERRADLFKDFERLGAEKTGLEGAGLGLALSNEIARLQNGTLGVGDGELGGGLFWLELPLWSENSAAA